MELQLVARIPCMHHSSSSHHNTVTTFPALASQRVSLETAADSEWPLVLDRMLRCCTAAPCSSWPSPLSVGAARSQHPHHLSSARGDQRLAWLRTMELTTN